MFILTMIFLVIFIVCMVILIVLELDDYDDEFEVCIVGAVMSAIILIIFLVAIPFSRFSHFDDIEKFNAFRQTLNEQRIEANEYERAIITGKIIEWNADLAGRKNRNVWYRNDLWIPDEIMELEPIK